MKVADIVVAALEKRFPNLILESRLVEENLNFLKDGKFDLFDPSVVSTEISDFNVVEGDKLQKSALLQCMDTLDIQPQLIETDFDFLPNSLDRNEYLHSAECYLASGDSEIFWFNMTSKEKRAQIFELFDKKFTDGVVGTAEIFALLVVGTTCIFEGQYIVAHKNFSKELAILKLKLSLLVESKPFEKFVPVNSIALLSNPKFSVNPEHIQFRGIIESYSASLRREEITQKFLSLYHILENFMTKNLIVEMQRSTLPDPVGVRHFNEFLRDKSDEKAKLQSFLTKCFESGLVNSLQALVDFYEGTAGDVAVNIRREFSIGALKGDYKKKEIYLAKKNGKRFLNSHYLSELIYRIRCGIVHNKETDFHISPADVSGPLEVLVLDLIRIMQELVVGLILNKNDLVWYRDPQIKLY